MTPLETWLHRAVRGLTPESAEQVRSEITEHYESARAAGKTPEAALTALGHPRAANRQYRRALPTVMEIRYLQYLRQYESLIPMRYSFLGFGWMVAMHLLVGIARWESGHRTSALALFGCALVWGFVWRRVSLLRRTSEHAERYRRETYLAFAAEFLLLPFVGVPWPVMGPAIGALALLGIVTMRLHASIRRKLPLQEWPDSLNL